jgi:soluble lytic murein transglycosylase-like protein
MSQTARGRRLSSGQALARQALGFGVLVLVMSIGYAVSRVTIADSTERDVEVVADESTASAPAAISAVDINAHIVEVATRYGVEPKLVAAIVAVESQFDARAVSRRGAEGLMQLMPATAADLDVQDSFDPRDNIDGGVRHLKRLMLRFHNDVPLALAAYNAGEQAVINHRGIPPYRETRQYVVRVLRRYDRDAARTVAQQLAKPRVASTPKVTPVTYAGRVTVVPLTPAPALTPAPTLTPTPPSPDEDWGAPPQKKRSESP